jgi:hypothetical protein
MQRSGGFETRKVGFKDLAAVGREKFGSLEFTY